MPHWESDSFNIYSFLRDGTPELEKALFNELKIRPKGFYFDPRFRAGIWDGYERYFDLQEKRMFTGMVPFARLAGFDFEEVITAKSPLEVIDFNYDYEADLKDPRDPSKQIILNSYQNEAILAIIEGSRRGIFDHITASGKTVIIAAICALLKPLKILVTVPTINLLKQTKKNLSLILGEEIGQLGSGAKDFENRVVVCYDGFLKQYGTSPFVKNLAFGTQVLICDELQTVTKKLFPFFKRCVHAYFRFGFSGSFFEIDEDRIFTVAGHFGGVITSVTDEDTLDQGRSVPPKFTFFEYPTPKTTFGDEFGQAYQDSIVENEGLNKFFAKKLQGPFEKQKTILVLVKRVKHCALIQDELTKIGIPSAVYHGKVNQDSREDLLEDFSAGTLQILIATEQTLGTGTDIPRISLLLNLGGGLSSNQNKQKYGRALRSTEGKESVEIWEPYFTGNKWFLKHSKARLALAKRYSTGKVKLQLVSGAETLV